MADVTRWIFHPDDAVNMPELDPDGRLAYQGPFEYVPLADHLTALERVRVETLREARGILGDRYDWQRNEIAPCRRPLPDEQRFLDGIEDALNAIDCLINAETTGGTDD